MQGRIKGEHRIKGVKKMQLTDRNKKECEKRENEKHSKCDMSIPQEITDDIVCKNSYIHVSKSKWIKKFLKWGNEVDFGQIFGLAQTLYLWHWIWPRW